MSAINEIKSDVDQSLPRAVQRCSQLGDSGTMRTALSRHPDTISVTHLARESSLSDWSLVTACYEIDDDDENRRLFEMTQGFTWPRSFALMLKTCCPQVFSKRS